MIIIYYCGSLLPSNVVAIKDYVCDLKGTSSGLSGIFSPAIKVRKIVKEWKDATRIEIWQATR